ncbi:MAG: hypothetical protein JW867_02110 [Candidatus Omnitrophica bacterium]|nr:hypothetical protein [Candidatus Omnitrophota bacterium]
MKNFINIFVFWVCLLLPCCILTAEYIFSPEDYLIYSTVLDQWYGNDPDKMISIRGQTALGLGLDSLKEEMDHVKSSTLGLRPSVINDFVAKNIHSYPLEGYITQRAWYRIITPQEINYIFSYKDGWDRYYEKYPGSRGILTFSRVGYSLRGAQALVYAGTQWDDFSGAGVYVLLNKDPLGVWKMQETVKSWHSWLPDEDISLIPR